MAESKARTLTRSTILIGLALTGCPEEDLSPYLDQGACNSNDDCVQGFHCEQQACVKDGVDAGVEADPCGCTPPLSCCGTSCVNLKNDSAHCGTCDNDCNHSECGGGGCTELCEDGFVSCDGNIVNGCEVVGEVCPDGG